MGMLPFVLAAALTLAAADWNAGASAGERHRIATPPHVDTLPALCAPLLQLGRAEPCPALGPGAYAASLASARLPEPLPVPPVESLPKPEKVLDFTYARVTTPGAPLFATFEDAVAGIAANTTGAGFIFVNLVEPAPAGDQLFYRIRSGDYIRAADVSEIAPTRFQGVALSGRPAYPLAWLVSNTRPSPVPGAVAPHEARLLARYRLVQIFAAQRVGAWEWYLIGPGEWVEQRAVSRVNLNPAPEGVSGRWIQVDLYEQNLVAYEGGQPVYATLVSSGLSKWATEPGLFQVWARLKTDHMSGAYEPDRSDYYALEAVPWVLYFDGSRALHGEYWHDWLGFRRSHGCVNLAPLDARWLFDFAAKGTPVWVYDSAPVQAVEAGAGEGP